MADSLRGECVCISAFTPDLAEWGVEPGCGALIIQVRDVTQFGTVGMILFKEVAVTICSATAPADGDKA